MNMTVRSFETSSGIRVWLWMKGNLWRQMETLSAQRLCRYHQQGCFSYSYLVLCVKQFRAKIDFVRYRQSNNIFVFGCGTIIVVVVIVVFDDDDDDIGIFTFYKFWLNPFTRFQIVVQIVIGSLNGRSKHCIMSMISILSMKHYLMLFTLFKTKIVLRFSSIFLFSNLILQSKFDLWHLIVTWGAKLWKMMCILNFNIFLLYSAFS